MVMKKRIILIIVVVVTKKAMERMIVNRSRSFTVLFLKLRLNQRPAVQRSSRLIQMVQVQKDNPDPEPGIVTRTTVSRVGQLQPSSNCGLKHTTASRTEQ